ncbi:MAG: DnaB-like helicase C-terminal domain-containing protein [Nocardioides sp.]
MDPQLHVMSSVIDRVNERARTGVDNPQIWPTGFPILDEVLDGGFRAGNLILLAGPAGQGKTTMSLQIARNAAAQGRAVAYFCYEHDPDVLLQKFVSLEVGELYDHHAPNQDVVRRVFENTEATPGGLETRLMENPPIAEAFRYLLKYENNLYIHRSTGSTTTHEVIYNAVQEVMQHCGQPPLVIIDYLQKVKVDGGLVEDERVTLTVEALKDMAITLHVPVLALSAADKEGLQAGKRMRAQHLRGSTALAYECDVMLIINSKYDVVSRQHLDYGASNLERYKSFSVVSVEKNRNGRAGIDMEFKKRFEQNRFETDGSVVKDTLVDERLVLE